MLRGAHHLRIGVPIFLFDNHHLSSFYNAHMLGLHLRKMHKDCVRFKKFTLPNSAGTSHVR